jgi:hypothetical protein
MSGRRLLSGLAGTWTVSRSPVGPSRLARVFGWPQRWATSWTAALLGRPDLPGIGELAALRPATRVLIAGLSGWIALVGLVTLMAMVWVQVSAMSLPEWLGTSSPVTRGAGGRSPAGFDNIIQRPLFSRNRQGVTVAAVPVLAPPPTASTLDQGVTLKGVFISGALAKAFMLSSQSPLGVWIQAGQEIAGWRVVAVEPDRVILDGQDEKLVVQLHAGGGK